MAVLYGDVVGCVDLIWKLVAAAVTELPVGGQGHRGAVVVDNVDSLVAGSVFVGAVCSQNSEFVQLEEKYRLIRIFYLFSLRF